MLNLKKSTSLLLTVMCFFILSLVSCKNNPRNDKYYNLSSDTILSIQAEKTFRYSKSTLAIENESVGDATFFITPSSNNLYNDSTILASILHDSLNEKDKCFKLWQFIANWTYHQKPLSELNNQLSEPAILLNAFEYGYCDDRNMALAKLARIAGVKSRVYNLNGHVVAEMFYNNGWHMFDSDKNIIYEKPDKEVADIAYLTLHTELIDQKNNELEFYFDRYRNKKTKEALITTKDNTLTSLNDTQTPKYNSGIRLHPNDILEMTCNKVNSLSKWLWVDLVRRNGSLYNCEGLLKQKIELEACNNVNGDYYFASDTLPYAITQTTIEFNSRCKIYYSNDNTHWHYKGKSGNGKSSVSFKPYNPLNDPFTFYYFLKIVPENASSKNNLNLINQFTFSDKLLINNQEQSFRIVPLNKDGGKLKVRFAQE